MIEIRTVDQLEIDGARVFYRVDYNVPLAEGRVGDSTRIEGTIPTLLMLRERGAAIVIASHLGRPKGMPVEKFSLRPVRDALADLISLDVQFAADCIGGEAKTKAAALKPGQILLLENLRFHPGEEKNDAEFAASLKSLASIYVNDAFGASHRSHASIVALPKMFPSDKVAGGFLLMRELQFLQKVTHVSDRPFVALLGGAKIAGKIEPLEALVDLADTVLIGGGMANTFLAAKGKRMGGSLVDRESIEVATKILGEKHRATLVLPQDLVVTDSIDQPGHVKTVPADSGVEQEDRAVDIGPVTTARFSSMLSQAKTIFWNGPMGVFEKEPFARGTMAMARAVAEAGATSIVGGGESVEAVKRSGFADRISHISTGGGASLEFISGMPLPGVVVLEEALRGSGN